MKTTFALLSAALVAGATAFAQDASDKQLTSTRYREVATTEERTALDLFQVDGSYVFGSDVKRDGINYGEQEAVDSSIDYSHRFFLAGKIYLRLGGAYGRFDFGETAAPIPDSLQYVNARVALEYMVGNDIGAFLQFNPGFYTERAFNISSFDIPITAGRVFVLQPRKLFLFVGVNTAFLRGEYPVLPLVGLVWRPNPQWTLNLLPPDPRVIYSPNKNLDFWVGGQLVGWSFRTDRENAIVPQRLNGAQIDYSEYRGALGITFHPSEHVAVDLGGGYVFQRRFNFERAGVEYKADGAPFVRASLKAEF